MFEAYRVATGNHHFLDVIETPTNAHGEVVEVSELLGLKRNAMARADHENEIVFGLIIEDFKAFRREIRMKYFAFRVERIAELLLCKIKDVGTQRSRDHVLATIFAIWTSLLTAPSIRTPQRRTYAPGADLQLESALALLCPDKLKRRTALVTPAP